MKILILNGIEDRGGQIATTILAGYYKFYGATILRNYNGATAIVEYDEELQVPPVCKGNK